MKTVQKSLILFIATTLFSLADTQQVNAQAHVSFQVFYDALSPYGYWVDNPAYGYVWVPTVTADFTPYGTNGYWVYSDVGWTWVSYYSWGWAPFHYGRWFTDPVYGPMWVPGNEWGPGWVSWRRSGEYYGWAPIEPGISINVAYSNGYRVPNDRWRFVHCNDFGRRDINNYYVNRSSNVTIINNTTIINNVHVDHSRNTSYNVGPDRAEVQTRTHVVVTPVAIKESNKPGQSLVKNQLQLYRPQVQKANSNGVKPVPAKVENIKNVKPIGQRSAETKTQSPVNVNNNHPSAPQKNAQVVKHETVKNPRVTQPANSRPAEQRPVEQKQYPRSAQQRPIEQKQNPQPEQQRPVQPRTQEQRPQQQHPRELRMQEQRPTPQRQVHPTERKPQREIHQGAAQNRDENPRH